LNFGGKFHEEDKLRKQLNGDGDLWRRILCSAIVFVAYFIKMRMRMKMENKYEFVYYCKIETNNLCFMCLEFIVSPFLLLRTSKKPYHDNQHQPSPLPTNEINIKHTPTQHTTASNQQKLKNIRWSETRWMQLLLRGAAVDMAALCCHQRCVRFLLAPRCLKAVIKQLKAVPWCVNRDDAAGKCSSMEQRSICSNAVVHMRMCININHDCEQADVNGGAHVNISAVIAECAHYNYANEAKVVANVQVNEHMYRNIATETFSSFCVRVAWSKLCQLGSGDCMPMSRFPFDQLDRVTTIFPVPSQ